MHEKQNGKLLELIYLATKKYLIEDNLYHKNMAHRIFNRIIYGSGVSGRIAALHFFLELIFPHHANDEEINQIIEQFAKKERNSPCLNYLEKEKTSNPLKETLHWLTTVSDDEIMITHINELEEEVLAQQLATILRNLKSGNKLAGSVKYRSRLVEALLFYHGETQQKITADIKNMLATCVRNLQQGGTIDESMMKLFCLLRALNSVMPTENNTDVSLSYKDYEARFGVQSQLNHENVSSGVRK